MQDTTTSGTAFGAIAGTAIIALLMPEFSLPYLAASALVGGTTGAVVGYGISAGDDFLNNHPVLSTGGVALGLLAIGAGLYLAYKYA